MPGKFLENLQSKPFNCLTVFKIRRQMSLALLQMTSLFVSKTNSALLVCGATWSPVAAGTQRHQDTGGCNK